MDLIKYHNDINKLKLGNFTTKELDVFFSLLLKARDEKTENIIISYSEIKELIQEEQNQARLTNYIRGVSRKLKELNQEIELPNGDIVIFGLFDTITIKPKDKRIVFSVNEIFRYMIDDLVKNFTMFDLRELVSLKGIYPKTLFRLLKQWETTKMYTVKINEFRDLMGIPDTYMMKNIRQKVLKPCLEELEKNFPKLELKELKKGRNTETLQFTWEAKKKQKRVENIEVIEIVKRKKVLGEKELREHENIIQEREQENKIIDQVKNKKVDKIKITNEEYRQLYLKHCKEHNIEPTNKVVKLAFDQANLKKYEVIEQKKRKIRPKKTMVVGTEISENLLLSAKGKKLFGIARKNKIEKILEQMARRKAIKNFKYNYKYMVIERIFGSGKSENIESNLQELKKTLTKEQLKQLEDFLKTINNDETLHQEK